MVIVTYNLFQYNIFMNSYKTLNIWPIYIDLTHFYIPYASFFFFLTVYFLLLSWLLLIYLLMLDFAYGESLILNCIPELYLLSIMISKFNHFPLRSIILHKLNLPIGTCACDILLINFMEIETNFMTCLEYCSSKYWCAVTSTMSKFSFLQEYIKGEKHGL